LLAQTLPDRHRHGYPQEMGRVRHSGRTQDVQCRAQAERRWPDESHRLRRRRTGTAVRGAWLGSVQAELD
jgi:hypothetical protein